MISCTERFALGPVVQVGEDDPPAHPVSDVHHAEEALDPLGLGLDGLGLPLVAVSVGQRGTLGRDDEGEEPAPVFRRTNSRLSERKTKTAPAVTRSAPTTTTSRCRKREAQGPGIPRSQPVEALLQDPVHPAVPRGYPQDLGAEHGRQGQRHEAGDDHRPRHRNTELIEEPAGRALEEGQRA